MLEAWASEAMFRGQGYKATGSAVAVRQTLNSPHQSNLMTAVAIRMPERAVQSKFSTSDDDHNIKLLCYHTSKLMHREYPGSCLI